MGCELSFDTRQVTHSHEILALRFFWRKHFLCFCLSHTHKQRAFKRARAVTCAVVSPGGLWASGWSAAARAGRVWGHAWLPACRWAGTGSGWCRTSPSVRKAPSPLPRRTASYSAAPPSGTPSSGPRLVKQLNNLDIMLLNFYYCKNKNIKYNKAIWLFGLFSRKVFPPCGDFTLWGRGGAGKEGEETGVSRENPWHPVKGYTVNWHDNNECNNGIKIYI